MMDIGKEASGHLNGGHMVVGTKAEQITFVQYEVWKGVLLRAPGSGDPVPNTAPIWVGGPSVEPGSGSKGGMPLLPGESMFLPVDDITKLWVISTAENQDLAWLAS